MRKKLLIGAVVVFSIILSGNLWARQSIGVTARAVVLMDATTGKILYSRNSYAIMEPASTTKIMTGILAIEKGNLNQTVTVSRRAAEQSGTAMNLRVKEHRTIQELLYGLLLVSGNDAAVAVAESVSGSEENFVTLMNAKARAVGMKYTKFKNPSGLPALNHYTTAIDMAKLARYAMQNRLFAQIVSTKSTTVSHREGGPVRKLINHNKLLWRYPYTTGIKTGYTRNAGKCLVASANMVVMF